MDHSHKGRIHVISKMERSHFTKDHRATPLPFYIVDDAAFTTQLLIASLPFSASITTAGTWRWAKLTLTLTYRITAPTTNTFEVYGIYYVRTQFSICASSTLTSSLLTWWRPVTASPLSAVARTIARPSWRPTRPDGDWPRRAMVRQSSMTAGQRMHRSKRMRMMLTTTTTMTTPTTTMWCSKRWWQVTLLCFCDRAESGANG